MASTAIVIAAFIITLLATIEQHRCFGGPLCNVCVATKSLYWKTRNTFSRTNRNYFVCKFAEDARNCNTDWSCVGWFVGARFALDGYQGNAMNAGRDGWNGKGCSRYAGK
jgi:hypothetical protein